MVSVTEGAPRGPYAKSAARRKEIIEAGLTAFSTTGYRSSSLREIARQVGMSQSGLLHHFASKEELLLEILQLRDAESRAAAFGRNGADAIREIPRLVGRNSQRPGVVALHAVLSAEATNPEHPAYEYFQKRYDETVRNIAAALADLKQEGLTPQHIDPVAEAQSLVALMDGLQVQWLLNPDGVDMVARVRAYLVSITLIDI